jgi:outer membrane protein
MTLNGVGRTAVRVACGVIFTAALSAPAIGGDLMGFYQQALRNDPQLGGAQYENLASKEALTQAYGGVRPRANFEFDWGYTRQEIKSSDNRVYGTGTTDYASYQYSLTVTQPLFNYQSWLSIGQAKDSINRSDAELEKARQDLILRVGEAYLNVLLAQDKVTVAKAQVAAVDLLHTVAKARTDAGNAPITELYDTEARLASVKAEQESAETLLEDSIQAMREIAGAGDVTVKRMKDEIPMASPAPDNAAAWVAETRKRNPDILIQQYKADISGKEVDRQKAGHYPTLDLTGDYIVKDTNGTLFGGGSNTANYDLMLKFSLPIYEGGSTSSKTREASNLRKSALSALDRQTRAAERRTFNAFNEIRTAIGRANAMKKSVEAQKLVVEARETGFKSGKYISLAVLDALQDLYRYKKEQAQARNDYLLNTVRLNHAVGTLKEEHLKQINAWLE